MADRDVDVLIVGAGAAGSACAEALARDRGFGGSVLLVGREQDPPYERPPASKDYLRGECSREDAYLHPAGWYGERGVELLTRTSVMKLDTEARVAKLSTKEEVGYGAAVLATGANVRRLRVPGAELEASTTCARSATRTRSAPTPRRPSGWCWSAAPTSPARSPPR